MNNIVRCLLISAEMGLSFASIGLAGIPEMAKKKGKKKGKDDAKSDAKKKKKK